MTFPAPIKILLVEDDPEDAFLLKEALTEAGAAGFDLTHVPMLETAVERLSDGGFDVVLLDLSLPDGSGLETVKRTMPAAPDVPIVVLTGYSDEAFALSALREGAEDYLIKGQFTGKELVRAIGYAIERHRLLTEQRRLEAQLRHSQKIESVGRLAAGGAHDFNNFLTVIDSFTTLLMDGEQVSPRGRMFLEQMLEASRRAANLTRQLLAFSRQEKMCRTVLDLNQVVRNLAKILQHLLGENVELDCKCAEELPPILADEGLTEQVIMNLAVNARDAMPKGGRLGIRTERVELDAAQSSGNPEARPGKFVCLIVQDTGSGMEAAVLNRIFEPFFTTKAVGKGSGLGLSIVYGIIKQHGGWIEVESAPNQGTTFRLFFEAQPIPVPPPDSTAKDAGSHGGSETILLVEDDPRVRSSGREILMHSGYAVLEASSGEEAWKVFHQNGHRIDLLLADLILPGEINGIDLAKRLLVEQPSLAALFTSGYSFEAKEEGIELREGVNFLRKPYGGDSLLRAVRRSLDQTTSVNFG